MIEAYFRSGVRIDGIWVYSQRACLDDFREHFPELAVIPKDFYNCLSNCVGVFRETGSVGHKSRTGRPTVRSEQVINDVRQRMVNEPTKPLKHLSQEIGLSYGTCQKIVKKNLHMHPYKMQSHQAILPVDYPRRRAYCQWFANNLIEDDNLLNLSFFSDEAWFHLSGYVNSQNTRMWSSENPHIFIESFLHNAKLGVWLAVSRRRVVGPIFFNFTINAERYRNILNEFIEQLHEDELQYGYFQHDGATAHTTRENIAFLREFFDDRIISLHTEVEFPPRSPCLTIMDFFVFPHLKNRIFKTPVANLQDLQQRIIDECALITPAMLQNAFNSMKRRVTLGIENNGQQFQHLL